MTSASRLGLAALAAVLMFACAGLPSTFAVTIAGPTQADLGQVVQSTLQALTAEAQAQPSATPPPMSTATTALSTGSISGRLSYPADSLPSMYVTAYRVGSQEYKYVITNPGQDTYLIDGLAPGMYNVIAYTVGGGGFPAGLAGGYTEAVLCGLGANCTDHSLIAVSVEAGSTQTGIIPRDWFAPRGSFPDFPPGFGPTGTPTLPASADGGISGNLMYPASGIPALRIVAYQIDGSAYYYVDTSPGATTYQLAHLPPGTYHVVAYPLPSPGFSGGGPGGYSQMVLCGLQAGCADHTLIDVVVTAGHVTTGVDPNDYYAAPGTFPPDPVP